MRVALARHAVRRARSPPADYYFPSLIASTSRPTILDLEGTLWLEEHLARYPRTVIVISHDRDLLDNAVDWILNFEAGKLSLYRGGYTAFERQRRERQALDFKLAKKQDAERKRLVAFVDRFRAKATKARQAQSRLKLLAKLEPIAAVVADEVRPIEIPAPAKLLSPPIIAAEGVAVGYEPGVPVLRRLTLRVDDDDRIALLGANGNGKSTLVKLIAGRLAPMSGQVTRADKLEVGYFAQHQLDELDPDGSAYDQCAA
jgi:ATP-binding cassette subfamily F protein 3